MQYSNTKDGNNELSTCDICGKKYLRPKSSIYKVLFGGKTYHFCSYTCYCRGLEAKKSNNSYYYQKEK